MLIYLCLGENTGKQIHTPRWLSLVLLGEGGRRRWWELSPFPTAPALCLLVSFCPAVHQDSQGTPPRYDSVFTGSSPSLWPLHPRSSISKPPTELRQVSSECWSPVLSSPAPTPLQGSFTRDFLQQAPSYLPFKIQLWVLQKEKRKQLWEPLHCTWFLSRQGLASWHVQKPSKQHERINENQHRAWWAGAHCGKEVAAPAPARMCSYTSPARQTIWFFKTETQHTLGRANTHFLATGAIFKCHGKPILR